jgi:Protein of unknown function (DUF2786)
MENNTEKVIDRVRKLLALAGNNTSAAEAAAAAAKANKLIDEYRLSSVDYEETEVNTQEPIEEDPDYIYESGKVTAWRCLLIKVLCRHYGVAHWNDTSYATGRKVSRYRLVGRRSDIGFVRYLNTYLTSECIRLSQAEAKGMGRVFVASYCEGFVNGVAEQLKVSRVEAKANASSSAIVKIDARQQEAREEMYKLHTNLRTVKSASYAQHDKMAFAAGQQRGKNIHLGASLSTGGTKLLNG